MQNQAIENPVAVKRSFPSTQSICLLSAVVLTSTSIAPVLALPPATDPPEEIQRTEIITEARSPLNGAPLTAAEYAELEAQIQENPNAAPIKQEYRRLITLLRIRRAIRSVFPFLVR